MHAHSRGARARASRLVLVTATIALGFVVPPPHAGATSVNCDGINDVADVQGAVNGAGPGGTVQLSGTCDFTAGGLQPLGGSAVVAAVYVRPGGISGLTISGPATIVGSGTQTAIAVGANSADVTIRDITFRALARSIVAVSGPTVVRYGVAGLESASVPNIPLAGLRIQGNTMDDSPPSEGDAPIEDWVGVHVIGNAGGVDRLLVFGNAVGVLTDGLAAGDGVRVTGPVTRAVMCSNTLNGTLDDPAHVSFSPGAESTGNAFPGGSAFADNMECTPTLAASPAILPSGGTLTASGLSWAARPATVTVKDENGATATKSPTASDVGGYTATFSSADLGVLADGLLRVVTTATDPSGTSRDSAPVVVRKNFVADPPPAGTVAINDGDGYMNAVELAVQAVTASWTAPSGPVEAANVWWADSNNTTPAACGPFRVVPTGSIQLARPCSDLLAQGTFTFNAFWEKSDGEGSPSVGDTSIKDTLAVPPEISSPANGSTVDTSPVPVTGITEAFANVSVTERGLDGSFSVVSNVTANGSGAWATSLSLGNGSHTISAYIHDPAGNRGGSTSPVQFRVDTSTPPPPDTTPPDAPVITAPPSGTARPGRFLVSGTSESTSSITVYTGTTPVGSGGTDGLGNFVAAVNLPAGTWPLRAKATDAAGNTSVGFSNEITVEIDTTPPALVVDTEDGFVFGSFEPVVISGTVSDNRAVHYVAVQYKRLGSVIATDIAFVCNSGCVTPTPMNWSTDEDLPPGVYDVTVFGLDWFDFPPNYPVPQYPPNIAVKTLQIIKVP